MVPVVVLVVTVYLIVSLQIVIHCYAGMTLFSLEKGHVTCENVVTLISQENLYERGEDPLTNNFPGQFVDLLEE